MVHKLDDRIFVSGQIAPAEVAELARQGFALIVNNRPDHEEPGQPEAFEIEAAAAASGIAYRYVPVAQLTPEAIEAMRDAMASTEGPVLAFCKSGTRSTYLWALARSLDGTDGDTLVQDAAAAGFDLNPIRRFLR